MNYIYLDTETTGLDPKNNSIVQLAGFIKVGNKEVTFNYKMRPYHGESVDPYASKVTGITTEMVYSWDDPKEVFAQFIELLDSFNITYSTKFHLIGYNVGFDDEFMREWFSINGKKWGCYVWFPYIDVMALANLYYLNRRPSVPNFKLVTIYRETFGKDFSDAHNALSDIIATRELFEFFCKKFFFLPIPMIEEEKDEEEKPSPKIKVRPKRIVV